MSQDAPEGAPAPALELSQDDVYAIIGRQQVEIAALRRLLAQAGAALAAAQARVQELEATGAAGGVDAEA